MCHHCFKPDKEYVNRSLKGHNDSAVLLWNTRNWWPLLFQIWWSSSADYCENVSLCVTHHMSASFVFVFQDWPEVGPLVRLGDELWPLEGAFVSGWSQNSGHEVYEPDQTDCEYRRQLPDSFLTLKRGRKCLQSCRVIDWSEVQVCLISGVRNFDLFLFAEHLTEDTLWCAVNETNVKQGELLQERL